MQSGKLLIPAIGLGLAAGCSSGAKTDTTAKKTEARHDHDHGHSHGGHEHKPPHGGTLVGFGQEFAHLELVLDAATGTLTVYVLDGEAEKAIRIAAPELEIKAQLPGADGKTSEVVLKVAAQADTLTGEKVGDTSLYKVQHDALKNAKVFDAVVSAITVKGKDFKDTKFNFPKGNE